MSPLTRASLVYYLTFVITNWPGINSCCSHTKQPLQTCTADLERGGEGRKRERGLGREGKGLPFPFALFFPSPPLLSPVLRLPRNLTSSKKQKCLEPYWKKTKNKSYEKFLNSIFLVVYLWGKLSDGANTSRSSPELQHIYNNEQCSTKALPPYF